MEALNEYIKMCSQASMQQQQQSSGSSGNSGGTPIYMPMISGSSTSFTGALAPMTRTQQQQPDQQQMD